MNEDVFFLLEEGFFYQAVCFQLFSSTSSRLPDCMFVKSFVGLRCKNDFLIQLPFSF